jgi:formylglycine-generating enzyme required for sulfatase activity
MPTKKTTTRKADPMASSADAIEAIQSWSAQHGRLPTEQEWQHSCKEHPSAQSVSRRFGSWKGAMAAAGHPLEPGHRPLGTR